MTGNGKLIQKFDLHVLLRFLRYTLLLTWPAFLRQPSFVILLHLKTSVYIPLVLAVRSLIMLLFIFFIFMLFSSRSQCRLGSVQQLFVCFQKHNMDCSG